MTPKQKVVLRTAFPGDVYSVGDLEITADGTEVPSSDVDRIVGEAKAAGVGLYEVTPADVPVETKTEGGKP